MSSINSLCIFNQCRVLLETVRLHLCGGQGWAHSIECPWVPICSPLTQIWTFSFDFVSFGTIFILPLSTFSPTLCSFVCSLLANNVCFVQTCPGKCDQLKDCVLCVGFGTGKYKDDMDKCRELCNDTVVVDELDGQWRRFIYVAHYFFSTLLSSAGTRSVLIKGHMQRTMKLHVWNSY